MGLAGFGGTAVCHNGRLSPVGCRSRGAMLAYMRSDLFLMFFGG